MYSGLVAAAVLVVSVIFFLIYKRRMLVRLFSLDIAGQVDTFEKDIKDTADVAVTKIESASENLAQLLEDANETIEELKVRVKVAEEQLYKASINDVRQNVVFKTPQESKQKNTMQPTFAEQLIKASYQTALHLDEEEEQSLPVKKSRQSAKQPVQRQQQEEEQQIFAEEKIMHTPLQEELLEQAKAISDNVLDFPQMDMRGAEPKFKEKQILKLAASGYDDITIAKALQLGVGEVKLTRKLSQK